MNKGFIHVVNVTIDYFLDNCFHRLQVAGLRPILFQLYADLIYGILHRSVRAPARPRTPREPYAK